MKKNLLMLGLACCLSSSLSMAATYIPVEFNDLADKADGIIKGTVTAIHTGLDENDRISTWVTLGELDVIQGQYTGETYTLKLCGGSYKTQMTICSGTPSFTEGETVVTFLKQNGEADVPFVGGPQGLLRLTGDSIESESGDLIVGIANDRFLKQSEEEEAANVVLDARNDPQVPFPIKPPKQQIAKAPAKLTYRDLRQTIAGRSNPHRPFHSVRIPDNDRVVLRYPGLNRLQTNQDFDREFLEEPDDQRFLEKVAKYFEWRGLPKKEAQGFKQQLAKTKDRPNREQVLELYELALSEHVAEWRESEDSRRQRGNGKAAQATPPMDLTLPLTIDPSDYFQLNNKD